LDERVADADDGMTIVERAIFDVVRTSVAAAASATSRPERVARSETCCATSAI